jgi:hypothetical protein
MIYWQLGRLCRRAPALIPVEEIDPPPDEHTILMEFRGYTLGKIKSFFPNLDFCSFLLMYYQIAIGQYIALDYHNFKSSDNNMDNFVGLPAAPGTRWKFTIKFTPNRGYGISEEFSVTFESLLWVSIIDWARIRTLGFINITPVIDDSTMDILYSRNPHDLTCFHAAKAALLDLSSSVRKRASEYQCSDIYPACARLGVLSLFELAHSFKRAGCKIDIEGKITRPYCLSYYYIHETVQVVFDDSNVLSEDMFTCGPTFQDGQISEYFDFRESPKLKYSIMVPSRTSTRARMNSEKIMLIHDSSVDHDHDAVVVDDNIYFSAFGYKIASYLLENALNDECLLSNEVANLFIHFLYSIMTEDIKKIVHIFDASSHQYRSKQDYHKKLVSKQSLKFWFFPTLHKNHWTLWYYDVDKNALFLLDSLKTTASTARTLRKYIGGLMGKELDSRTTPYFRISCNTQTNGFDCGFFVLLHLVQCLVLLREQSKLDIKETFAEPGAIASMRGFVKYLCQRILDKNIGGVDIPEVPIWGKVDASLLPLGDLKSSSHHDSRDSRSEYDEMILDQVISESRSPEEHVSPIATTHDPKITHCLEPTHGPIAVGDLDKIRQFNYIEIAETAIKEQYLEHPFVPKVLGKTKWEPSDSIKLCVIIQLRKLYSTIRKPNKSIFGFSDTKPGRKKIYYYGSEKSQYSKFRKQLKDCNLLSELDSKISQLSSSWFSSKYQQLRSEQEKHHLQEPEQHLQEPEQHLQEPEQHLQEPEQQQYLHQSEQQQQQPVLLDLIGLPSKSGILFLSKSCYSPCRLGVFLRVDCKTGFSIIDSLPQEPGSFPRAGGSFLGLIFRNNILANVKIAGDKITCTRDIDAGFELVAAVEK